MNEHDRMFSMNSSGWAKKAAAFLFSSLRACELLREDRNTYEVCLSAINTCWTWMSGESVDPLDVAFFLDADEEDNSFMRESIFSENELKKSALIFITMTLGYVAHRMYTVANRSSEMSEIISEAGVEIEDGIFEWSEKLDLHDFIMELLRSKKR